MNIQWIFFDLDGTLADNISQMYTAYCGFLANFDLQGSEEEFQSLVGPSLKEVIAILSEKHSLPGTPEELFRIYNDKIEILYRDHIQPMSDATATLQYLHQQSYQMILVTAAHRSVAMSFLDRQPWDNYFAHYVFGDEVDQAKPNPALYLLALERAGVCHDQAVVVEDSKNGVLASTAAGIYTIGFAADSNGEDLTQSGAQAIVGGLEEIPPLLQSVGTS